MPPNNAPGNFSVEGVSADLAERVRALEAHVSVKELTALQVFSTRLTGVVAAAILCSVAFVCFVWYVHLPPVQGAGTTPEQLAAYREKSEIAGDDVERIIKNIVADVLWPLLCAVIGLLTGKRLAEKKSDG